MVLRVLELLLLEVLRVLKGKEVLLCICTFAVVNPNHLAS